MDEIDLAQQHIERELSSTIARASKAPPEAKPRGQCLYCEMRVPAGHRWCDAACRDDWQAETRGGHGG